jgi:hypothetical protein
MAANLFVVIVVVVVHLIIVRYLWMHRNACTTCSLRSKMLDEIRAALK